MCGIVGIFGDEINFPLENSIRRVTSTLKHRDPDDSGILLHKDNFLAFGHQRLSILDHSQKGYQTMASNESWLDSN